MRCGWVWAVMGQLCGVGSLVVWVAKRVKCEGNCVLCGVGGALVGPFWDCWLTRHVYAVVVQDHGSGQLGSAGRGHAGK